MKRFTHLIAILLLSANGFSQGHFAVDFSGNGHDHMNIYIITATIDGVNMEANDEIAAFDGSIRCGKTILTEAIDFFISDTYAALAPSRKDDGQLNGYTIGNAISFKIWDSSTGSELSNITAEFTDPINGQTIPPPTYTPGEAAFVKLSFTAPVNKVPVANAGLDQEVNEDVNVTLDGSASSDPDSAPNPDLTYTWTSVEGVTLNNASTVSPDFDTPFLLKDSLLHFVLVVNDGEDDSNPDTIAVKVNHKNLPPTADAGANFSANENTLVQLDGSGSSDLDGTITYKWTATGIAITGDDLVDPTFTAPEVQADSTITFTLTVTDNNLETDIATIDVLIKHVNKKPVANAGTDQEVDENIEITLDGSLSKDMDMYDVITYKWIAPTGIALDDVSAAKPKFTSPVIIEEYLDYIFKLVVNDGTIDSDTDRVVVRIIHLNFAPVADAGVDFDIDENTQGNLDGSNSSDFEGKPLTYSWIAPSGFVIDSPTAVTTTFTAPSVEKDTTYTVVLTVKDGVRFSIPDTIKVTVNQINKQPVANAGPDQTVDENVLVHLDGTASSDIDALDIISYLWTSLDGAVLDDNTSATPAFTSPWLMKDSIFDFNLVVNDGTVNSVADMVSVTVKHANLQPAADAGASPIVMNENSSSNLDGSASSDPEGMTLTYLWSAPVGISIADSNAAITTFTAAEVEKDTLYKIVLTVDDSESLLNTDTDTIFVTVVQVNKAPVANAGADITIREQKVVMLDGSSSSDPDALDAISYNWVAPAGIILDDATSSKPSFIGGDVAVDTEVIFILEVTDKSLATEKDTVKVTLTANKPPLADAGANQKVRTGATVTLHGENSSDPDGDILTYSWTAPLGITLSDPAIANPTFIAPDSNKDKTYSFMLEVSDDLGATDTHETDVTVISNLPPDIVTEPVVYVFEGDTVSLDASETTDPDGDVMTFNWFHADATLIKKIPLKNSNKPIVTFIAPQVENLTYMRIILRVYDGTENSSQVVKVYIKDIINIAPVANAGTDVMVNEGTTGNLDGSASSDTEGATLSYLWSSDYLVLDDTTAEKPEFVAPEATADTTVWITLVVNDGILSSTPDTVMVTIKRVNHLPVANAGADITVNEGGMITLDGSVSTDPDGDEITFSWSAFGITLPGNDFISITLPAPDVEEDMMIPVVLVVNDGELNSAPDTVWVNILQVNKMPEWGEVPADTAFVGYEYSAHISVTDPDVMDVISIFSDNLPAWLVIKDNGDGTAEISSDLIPRMEDLIGVHTFIVKASDGTETIETTVTLTITVQTLTEDVMLSAVKFYPNPTNGLVNVEFNSFPEMGTTIQVFNQLGQTVLKRHATSQNTELNLSNNSPGLYLIKVTTEKDSHTAKIILR